MKKLLQGLTSEVHAISNVQEFEKVIHKTITAAAVKHLSHMIFTVFKQKHNW